MSLPSAQWLWLLGFGLVGASCSNDVISAPTSTGTSTSGTTSTSSDTAAQGGGGAGAQGGAGTGGQVAGGSGGAPQAMCEDFDGVALIASKLYLGDTTLNDAPSPTAWKQFGFNIDGLISKKTDTNLCKPNAGAAQAAVYPDGNYGIDNAWGKLQLPIWTGLAPDLSMQVNEAITNGTGGTFLIKLDGLSASATNQDPVASKLYSAAPLLLTPKLDGSDCWPVTYASVANPADADSAKAVFPSATLVNNSWASGVAGNVQLRVNFLGVALPLQLNHVRLSMQLEPYHQAATVGQLGGVIDTEAFIAELKKVAGHFDLGLCTGTTFDSLADMIRQASDILSDGTQDPNKTCNAISFGMGFKATAVKFGKVAAKEPEPVDPCK